MLQEQDLAKFWTYACNDLGRGRAVRFFCWGSNSLEAMTAVNTASVCVSLEGEAKRALPFGERPDIGKLRNN